MSKIVEEFIKVEKVSKELFMDESNFDINEITSLEDVRSYFNALGNFLAVAKQRYSLNDLDVPTAYSLLMTDPKVKEELAQYYVNKSDGVKKM